MLTPTGGGQAPGVSPCDCPAAGTSGGISAVTFAPTCKYHGDSGKVIRIIDDQAIVQALRAGLVSVPTTELMASPPEPGMTPEDLRKMHQEAALIQRVGSLSLQLVEAHQQLSRLRLYPDA